LVARKERIAEEVDSSIVKGYLKGDSVCNRKGRTWTQIAGDRIIKALTWKTSQSTHQRSSTYPSRRKYGASK